MTELTILELFILSCIDRGLNTPYLMQREGGLSLGATSPTLPGLSKAGLVTRDTGQTCRNRPRHEYSLTALGKDQARKGWKKHLDLATPPTDVDALLRLTDMAIFYGGDTARLTGLIKRAALLRKNMADKSALEVIEFRSANHIPYREMRARLDVLRYRADGKALQHLASDVSRVSSKTKSKR